VDLKSTRHLPRAAQQKTKAAGVIKQADDG
jgi:hypothetical protein